MDDTEARDRVARIEGLLGEIETLSDPVARDRATETVQALRIWRGLRDAALTPL